MSKTRSPVPKRDKLAVFIRDNFTCAYCGCDLRNANKSLITIDHVIARVHGGKNNIRNLVTACEPCNSSRGCLRLEKWATGSQIRRVEKQLELPCSEPRKLAIQILKSATASPLWAKKGSGDM